MTNTVWRIEYDNDTGSDDGGFYEWWNVTDGNRSFRCETKDNAEWLLARLTG